MWKAEIRELSREFGLPTWDKPSFACLSSRFQYGDHITAAKLRQVDAAEEIVEDDGVILRERRKRGLPEHRTRNDDGVALRARHLVIQAAAGRQWDPPLACPRARRSLLLRAACRREHREEHEQWSRCSEC